MKAINNFNKLDVELVQYLFEAIHKDIETSKNTEFFLNEKELKEELLEYYRELYINEVFKNKGD